MRIIAGLRRGHKFDGPAGHSKTRPTSDFVRESIFNILGESVADRPVLDLFAGTGALGFEALSRGARHATFVECDRDQAAQIRRNLTVLKFADVGTVAPLDTYRFLRAYRPADESPILAFVDPPYAEYRNHTDRFRKGLTLLLGRAPAGSIVVVEGPDRFPPDALPDPDGWETYRYGSTVVAFRTVAEPPSVSDSGDEPTDSDGSAEPLAEGTDIETDGREPLDPET